MLFQRGRVGAVERHHQLIVQFLLLMVFGALGFRFWVFGWEEREGGEEESLAL